MGWRARAVGGVVTLGCAACTAQASRFTAPAAASPQQSAEGQTAKGQAGSLPAAEALLPAEAQTPAGAGLNSPASPTQGGTLRGSVVAGSPSKPGGTALPGATITATHTLTGRKYAAATDVNGVYALAIPRNGRYVLRVELAGFAPFTSEVVFGTGDSTSTSTSTSKQSNFGLELASRAAAQAEAREGTQGTRATSLTRGLQNLNLDASGGDAVGASAGAGNSGAALPTLGNLNDAVTGETANSGAEAIAVSGQTGQTNSLANFSEEEIRRRVDDAVTQARASGLIGQGGDPTNAIVGALGGLMAGGGPGGFGGGGGFGGRGGGGRGGGGAFRNFNPAQPHGSVFWQGGNTALNASNWVQTAPGLPHFTANPSGYNNRFGVSLAGSPYLPGVFKPNTKQFVFINMNGQKNLSPYFQSNRVPTLLERSGDFSQSFQTVNGVLAPVTLYDANGNPYPGNKLPSISPQAQALLAYYPAPNLPTSDPTGYNYQTISNAGNNNLSLNTRYVRTLGNGPTGPGAFFGGGGGGGRRNGGNANTPPALRQNINVAFNYQHAANDLRNIFLPLGGASENNGYGLNVGYTLGYGRFSNNASVSWNRNNAATRNYFTDTGNNPTAAAGVCVPNGASGACAASANDFADPRFYNGVPTIAVTNFASLSNQAPSLSLNQTISVSDFVSWRHSKHNLRLGLDIRRLHDDTVGGSNPLGRFTFTGYNTQSTADRNATAAGISRQAGSGSGFADFLLGLPTNTALQAGLYKLYLRENVFDWYAQDDYRVLPNLTLNAGLRWEYFSPYVEKNNRLVNLDHNADFTAVDAVLPGGSGTYLGKYPRSLVNPDHAMYAPRLGVAWRPKALPALTKGMVIRGGYGINYNTSQFSRFATLMAFQPPFANTQTNAQSTQANPNGCTVATMTLAHGFDCSGKTIQNNFSVNKDYRLGMVQVYNFDLQRTLPLNIVLNLDYNGSKGSDLDVLRAPNHTVTSVTTSNAQAFTYEDSVAASHLNQLLISLQKRQQRGIALGISYTYSHSIDNASSIGGGSSTQAQDDKRLDLEEANSSFDLRHRLAANWTLELPFGPNRAFFNKGGKTSALLDGFLLSGNLTIASGSYFTPSYTNSAAQALAGGNYTLRPDRVFSQPIGGTGQLFHFFNTAAFVAPNPNNGLAGFGTASRNSIEGPGTLSTNASLSRTVKLGETRSFEARATATNVFNTVQYNGINTTVNSATYGQVTSAAGMRTLELQARYRF